MKKLFIGPDGCIRSGWQMILLYLAMNIAQLAVIMPINIILGIIIGIQSTRGDVSGIGAFLTSYAYQSITIALCNLISLVAIIILFKAMNRKTTEDMGLTPVKRDYKDLLIGLLLGAASITLIIGINYIMGDTRFNGVHITWDLLLGLILFISVGFVEEILVRGCFQHIIY